MGKCSDNICWEYEKILIYKWQVSISPSKFTTSTWHQSCHQCVHFLQLFQHIIFYFFQIFIKNKKAHQLTTFSSCCSLLMGEKSSKEKRLQLVLLSTYLIFSYFFHKIVELFWMYILLCILTKCLLLFMEWYFYPSLIKKFLFNIDNVCQIHDRSYKSYAWCIVIYEKKIVYKFYIFSIKRSD